MSRLRIPIPAAMMLCSVLLLSSCTPGGDTAPTPTANDTPRADDTPPAQTDVSPTVTGSTLIGTGWILAAMAGEQITDGATVTLQFTEEGQLFGSGGCNRYNGEFTATAEALSIEPLGTTLMACEAAVMEREVAYIDALQGSTAFAADGDQLTLSDQSGAVILEFRAQSDDLFGSTWVVTGYNNGDGAVTSVVVESVADVTFAEDGSLSGTGGCNRIIGTYSAEGGALRIETSGMTMMECPEPAGVMEQESALVTALESATSYTMEGDELTLTTADSTTAVTLSRG